MCYEPRNRSNWSPVTQKCQKNQSWSGMILSQVHSHPLNHWHRRHDLQLAWTRWVIRECKLLDTSDLLHTSSTPHPSYRWAKMSTWCWFRLLAVWQCLQLDLSSSFSIIQFYEWNWLFTRDFSLWHPYFLMPIGSMDTLETISAGKSKIRAPTPNIFASVWHRFEENIMGRLATILGLWDSARPQNSGNSSITVFVRKL